VLINGFKNNAYNISNPHSIVTIKEMAEAMAHAAGVRVCYDNPSKSEQKGYSLMTNSSLNSNKLEKLGWYGVFDIKRGTEVTLDLMRSFVVTE
jgi:nucleoside-diphosphate-sugar epimerase